MEEFLRCLVVGILIEPNCPLEEYVQDADVSESCVLRNVGKIKVALSHGREMDFAFVTSQCRSKDYTWKLQSDRSIAQFKNKAKPPKLSQQSELCIEAIKAEVDSLL